MILDPSLRHHSRAALREADLFVSPALGNNMEPSLSTRVSLNGRDHTEGCINSASPYGRLAGKQTVPGRLGPGNQVGKPVALADIPGLLS